MRLMLVCAAALLPGFAVIGYSQYEAFAGQQEEVHDIAMRSAVLAASEVDRIIGGMEAVLTAVSEMPDVRDLREPACSSYVRNLLPRLVGVAGLVVLDKQGLLRCGSPSAPESADFADRPYVRRALDQTKMVIGEYTIGRGTQRPMLPVALAVRDGSGAAIGVLAGKIDLAWLGDTLKERGLAPGGALTVADRNGVILVREPSPERFVGTRIPDRFLHLVTAAAPGSETLMSQDGTRRIIAYVPVSFRPVALYVSVGLSTDSSYSDQRRTSWFSALLAGFGGIITLLTTVLVANRLFVRPLKQIEGVLDRWRNGEQSARTGRHDEEGEIGALGASIDRMKDEIDSMQAHRALLSDELLHRVKNTLAAVQAIATVSLNKPTAGCDLLPDFQSRIIALSGTHDVLTRERWERAELADVASQVARPLCADFASQFLLHGPVVQMSAHVALGMTMVLHELCTNAMKYGALSVQTGRVEISWSVQPGAETSLLEVIWRETGGPPVGEVGKAGFGTRMIKRALGQSATVELDFAAAGLTCRIRLPLVLPAAEKP